MPGDDPRRNGGKAVRVERRPFRGKYGGRREARLFLGFEEVKEGECRDGDTGLRRDSGQGPGIRGLYGGGRFVRVPRLPGN